MSADIYEFEIRTIDYAGPNRRVGSERRLTFDPRSIPRFDVNGGDRRSGFARRRSDDGFSDKDLL